MGWRDEMAQADKEVIRTMEDRLAVELEVCRDGISRVRQEANDAIEGLAADLDLPKNVDVVMDWARGWRQKLRDKDLALDSRLTAIEARLGSLSDRVADLDKRLGYSVQAGILLLYALYALYAHLGLEPELVGPKIIPGHVEIRKLPPSTPPAA